LKNPYQIRPERGSHGKKGKKREKRIEKKVNN